MGSRLTIWLIFFCFFASAQHPLVINYGKKDGLPSIEAYQVFQDKDGFIWVATDCGVAKYDGYQFKVFNTETGLRNNCVFKIFEDHRKRKWLTTSTNELCYIEDDKIVYPPCSEKLADLSGVYAAKRLIVDNNDNVYLSHRGKSSYLKVSPPYTNNSITPIYLDQTLGYGFIEEVGGNYIFGSNEAYMFCKPGDKLRLRFGKKIFPLERSYPLATPLYACPVGDGSYLFTEGLNLYRVYKDSACLVKKFDKNIISIQVIDKKEVWVGFYKGGVSKYELEGFRFVANMLNDYSVTTAFFDSEKNLWVSTLDGGVFSIPPLGTKFLNMSNGLTNENILTSFVFGKKLAVGSYDGAIMIIEGEKVTEINKSNPYFGNTNYTITSFDNKLLWGGGVGAFLIGEDGKIDKIYHALVRTASPGKNGVYLGSVNDLLYFDRHETKKIGSLNTRITKIHCDRKGKLWVGTNRGLKSYTGDSIKNEVNFSKYFNGKITDLKESSDGTLWVGTNGEGLFRIKGDEVIPFLEMKGDKIIACIYPDPQTKNLWVGTSQGLFLIDPVKLHKTKVITTRQYSFDITSIARIDNIMYLSTTKGIYMVDARDLIAEQKVPALYLSSIEANDTTYTVSDNLELSYSDARIKFTFKPIIFMGIPPVKYKYKLEGADDKWHFTQNNSVEYGFLKPGKYKFSVVACDEYGRNSTKTASFYFKVHSPIYLRTWFIGLTIFVISGLLTLAAFLLTRYSRQKEKIRNDNELKLADLELKALRSQMNPHFIFNSLNAVQGLILRNDSDGALTFMGKFSRLVRGVLENSEKPLISLSEEIASLELYLQLEQLKYDHIFNFSIVIDEDIVTNQIFLPSMLVQPLIENAIQHGVVESDRKGNIKVSFRKESDTTLLVVVEDNGVGFKNKKQKRPEDRISLGMKVTNERLVLLEKRMKRGKGITSEISVNSVLGGGTAVYLKVPVYGKTNIAGYHSR